MYIYIYHPTVYRGFWCDVQRTENELLGNIPSTRQDNLKTIDILLKKHANYKKQSNHVWKS